MNNLFVEFVNRLEKMSGNRDLCEAVLQGYLACHPIFEDAEGTAASRTKKIIKDRFGESSVSEIARHPETGKPLLTRKGKEQTVLDYIEHEIRGTFFTDRNDPVIKFEPGVARILFDEIGYQGESLENLGRDIGRLKGILKVIGAHKDEYDWNLNGMSLKQLEDRFGAAVKAASDVDYEKVSSAEYTKNDSYKIVEIHSFNEAKKYYEYTNPKSRWCLTHMKDQWEHYTAKGANRVYFVLKDGFKYMKPEKGENCPLDEYGLSMICVIVTNDINDENRPMMCFCTCRWNHENDGGRGDGIMNVEQISNVIGESFYDTFKPFSLEELHAKGIYTFREKLEKYNETHDRSLFDYVVFDFEEGCSTVKLNGKWNLIDEDGNFLWKGEKWFDDVGAFYEGYISVSLNGKWTFIDKDGNFLRNGEKWFDRVEGFHEGYAAVKLNGKWNFIDKDGNLVWKGEKWFDSVGNFKEGYARVKLNGKHNWIDKDGNLLWKGEDRFDWIENFNEGYAAVKLNGKWNFIDKDGNFLWKGEKWFDNVYEFYKGDAKVSLNGKWTFIDKEGKLHDY